MDWRHKELSGWWTKEQGYPARSKPSTSMILAAMANGSGGNGSQRKKSELVLD
jgi:hypothetical protein